jgi:hypothetical protein
MQVNRPWPGAMTLIEIRPFRNGWKCFEAPSVEPVFLDQSRQSTMLRVARVFALARFAFWIQLARSNASFRLIRRIEDCDASALDVLTAKSTSHELRVRATVLRPVHISLSLLCGEQKGQNRPREALGDHRSGPLAA